MKFFTPFLLVFPVWIVLSAMAWLGKFEEYNILPQQGILFIAIAFTMVVIDLFIKYFIGKEKVAFVWVIEVIMLIVLGFIIIPKFSNIIYV